MSFDKRYAKGLRSLVDNLRQVKSISDSGGSEVCQTCQFALRSYHRGRLFDTAMLKLILLANPRYHFSVEYSVFF